jgi:cytochrome P450
MQAVADNVDINFAETGQLGNAILDKIRAMREVDPIYRSEVNGGIWVVTGYNEVVEGFAGKKPLSAYRLPGAVLGQIPESEWAEKVPYLIETVPHWLINMDRPRQWRLRNLAMKAFGQGIAESMRPHVRQFIREAFDSVEGQDSIEFVDNIGRRVPARTILKLLGLSEDLYSSLHGWSIALNECLGGINLPEEVMLRGEKALHEMRAVFLPEIARRRENPTEDFISALVTARDAEGQGLHEEELLGILYVGLLAGHDTTANTISLGTAALCGMPDVRAYMRDHPDDMPDMVMEVMRYIAMATMQSRIASEDFDWNGHQIKKGDVVCLMIAGANRDPAVFPDPDTLDPSRPQGKNFTFAPGVHFCIGHFLAKVQTQEYFSALVNRYDPELLDDRLNFGMGLAFRGVDTMNVRLNPRKA